MRRGKTRTLGSKEKAIPGRAEIGDIADTGACALQNRNLEPIIMHTQTLSGSCLCRGVRYTVIGELQRFVHCHCSRCRKSTGTGHATNLFVKGAVKWESGEDLVRSFKVPE